MFGMRTSSHVCSMAIISLIYLFTFGSSRRRGRLSCWPASTTCWVWCAPLLRQFAEVLNNNVRVFARCRLYGARMMQVLRTARDVCEKMSPSTSVQPWRVVDVHDNGTFGTVNCGFAFVVHRPKILTADAHTAFAFKVVNMEHQREIDDLGVMNRSAG